MTDGWRAATFRALSRRGRSAALALGCLGVAVAALALAPLRGLEPLDLAAASDHSAVVLDRDGRLLRPFATANGRWRLPIETADVDPHFLGMLKAYEDDRFEQHRGVDLQALARAGAQLLRQRSVVSGCARSRGPSNWSGG